MSSFPVNPGGSPRRATPQSESTQEESQTEQTPARTTPPTRLEGGQAASESASSTSATSPSADVTRSSASEADFTFRVGDLDAEVLKVTGFTGTEEIGSLFNFRVTLCSSESNIGFDATVGKPCVLEIRTAGGTRYVNGIVQRFERSGEGSSLTYYAADLVPLHWLLTRRYKSRIFQESNCSDMSIPGVIGKVFEDAGIPTDNFRFALQGTYEPREYVVQYRESEMDFIARLMEEEGMFFFFEHTADRHVMVIGDGPVAHADTPDTSEFAYREQTGMVTEQDQEFVYELRDGQEIRTGAVALDDFNFKQPKANLAAAASADEYVSLEYSDCPGEYVDKSVGDRYAQVRLEEFQSARRVQQMQATVRALLTGYKFTLIEHPEAALNREYLVTRLVHEARQPQSGQEEAGAEFGLRYRADISTIPSDVPFRTPRRTPRPRIHGSQTAIVVGPSGEELYTDEYGRVKVQYHWDREGQYDEHSSRWTRVSHGSAGGQYGMMFLPRVGQEVIVEYLEGNPDEPIITGRVYNNDQMPPYSLPDEKTKSCIKTNSSKGGEGTNEFRFEDKKGSEQILIYAQNNLHLRTNTTRVENVGKDHHLSVKENKFELVEQNSNRTVTLDLTEEIGGKKSLKISGDLGEDVGGNHSEKVGQNYYLNSATNVVIEAGTNLTLKVGGNSIAITAAGIFISGSQVYLNSGSGATSAQAVALKSVEAPIDADSAVPGKDTTYSPQSLEYEGLDLAEQSEGEEEEQQLTSWVEIEMVDESGQPWPDEEYEITKPDGEVIRGRLDRNGQAHVQLEEPAETQVSFPRLDAEAWEKIQ